MTECTVLSQPDLVLVIIKSVLAVPCSVNGTLCATSAKGEREREREARAQSSDGQNVQPDKSD